jgi:hypothetical protein
MSELSKKHVLFKVRVIHDTAGEITIDCMATSEEDLRHYLLKNSPKITKIISIEQRGEDEA